MQLLVVGATGTLGRQIARRAIDAGHQVRCVVRSPRKAAFLQEWGCELTRGDLLEPDSLAYALEGQEAVIDAATARATDPGSAYTIDWTGKQNLFAACRREGDVVVAALNTDASVRSLKGPGRPLTPERDRAVVVGALADVDYVVLFDEATPAELVERVRPHVLVKGADWADKGVVGRATVEADGGRVVLVDLIPERSTTRLLEEARGADTMPAEDPA